MARAAGLGRIVRQAELLGILGISRMTLYGWRRRGLFPAPVRLGPRLLAWRIEEIKAWLEST